MQGERKGQHGGEGQQVGASLEACVLDGNEDGSGTDLSGNFPGSRLQTHHVFGTPKYQTKTFNLKSIS
eukprot:1296261-Prymnesium_polylepis.1